jgi:ring-1,2-phenylacetyl-CoA epoxidase subunit PaaC
VRFGDGTAVSHQRAQRALDALWPYTHELFDDDAVEEAVARSGIGVTGASLQPAWLENITGIVAEATLTLPKDSAFRSAGKLGRHSEHLGFVLAEMQSLARQHPDATW